MKKLIIYGLPRTGTNYLEYLVLNNLKCEYKTIFRKKSKYFEYDEGSKVSLKHTKPKIIKDCNCYILVLKNREQFLISAKKWRWYDSETLNEVYNNMLADYKRFYLNNKEKCLIIFHENLINNEEKFIKTISDKFNIEMNEKFVKTDMRMNKDGGKTVSEEVYSPYSKNYEHTKENKSYRLLYRKSFK